MPARKWFDRREERNLRGWTISLLTVLVAALLIAAIAEWPHRPTPATATATEEASH